MDILIIGGSGQLGKTLYNSLKKNYETIAFSKLHPISSAEYDGKVDRPKFSVLCNDKLVKEFIIPTDSYADYLKLELKEIYKYL
jgi:dTDP-4-dehydrorhamnose reductase